MANRKYEYSYDWDLCTDIRREVFSNGTFGKWEIHEEIVEVTFNRGLSDERTTYYRA